MAATIVRATLALNALIATLAEGTVVGGNPMGNFFGQMEGLPVRRMEYIDSARGAAVVLALLSHSFLQFASDFDSLRLLTRTATPAFLVIFGIMVEMVYLRKMRNGTERATIVKRLLSRAITCYVVFFAICAAAFATGKLEFYEALGAVLYLDDGRFGLILRIYAVLFVIVALMLTWAVRVGSTAFLAVAAAAFGLKYALDAIGLPGVYLGRASERDGVLT